MIEKAVIYNTIDRTGMCPEVIYDNKELPLGVSQRVDLTREQMKELFYLYELDHIDGSNKFGEKLLDYLHTGLLEWVENDKIIPYNETKETTIPKKYYLDAGMEESIDKNPIIHKHRPYGDSEFIR